jgi:hypothetical protein
LENSDEVFADWSLTFWATGPDKDRISGWDDAGGTIHPSVDYLKWKPTVGELVVSSLGVCGAACSVSITKYVAGELGEASETYCLSGCQ